MDRNNEPNAPLNIQTDAWAHADWLLDATAEGIEVLHTPTHALVLVDRAPLKSDGCGMGLVRKGLHGLGGSSLTPVSEIEHVTDDVLHGVYSGSVGNMAVLIDQYVECINGVPRTIIRVVNRTGSEQYSATFDMDRFVLDLMLVPEVKSRRAPAAVTTGRPLTKH